MHTNASTRKELALNRTSWRTPAVVLVCGGLILMLALGTRQSFGLFLRPMSMDLGWGREAFSFAIALQNLVWGLAMPFAGAVADRYGPGRVLITGGLTYGVGLLAMAHSTDPLALDIALGLLVGLGLSCTGFGVVFAVVARAFPPEKRSLAVGITGAFGSFGQFAMLPWGQALISGFGWLTALLVLGALAFLMVPLGAALAGNNPAARASDQSLGARYSKRLLLAWFYASRAVAIGLFLAAPVSPAGTYLFAAVMGLTWLGTVPLTNSLVGQIFGIKYLSTLFSIAFLGHQLGSFIGAWAGGAIFDLTGSYRLVWLAAIALSVVAAALCVPIDEHAIERPAVRGAA